MKMKLQWLKGKLRRGGGGAYKNGMSNLTFSPPPPATFYFALPLLRLNLNLKFCLIGEKQQYDIDH